MMWLLLFACGSDLDAASEMQRSIRGSEHALDATLLGAELFWWAEAPPTVSLRHGESCGCPCRERGQGTPPGGEGTSADLLLLDYAPYGCVPDSGLLPDELLGHVTLVEGADGFHPYVDGLQLEPAQDARGDGRTPIRTDLIGRWEEGQLHLQGSLVWNGSWAEITTTITPRDQGLVLSGEVLEPEAWVSLHDIEIAWDDLQGRCPRASGGAFTVWAPKEPVRLDAGADGRLTASWRSEISQPTDPCDVL